MRKREKEPGRSQDTRTALTVKERAREREGKKESQAAIRKEEAQEDNSNERIR